MKKRCLYAAAWTLLLAVSFVPPAFGNDSALIRASENGNLGDVRALLAKGANVNARNNDGWTALMWASLGGHLEVVRELLARGADVNARGNNGVTALHAASGIAVHGSSGVTAYGKGHPQVVRELLSRSADVNARGNGGPTALMLASYRGYLEVVRELLARGADVNAIADEGVTALQAASANGNLEMVRLLEEAVMTPVVVPLPSPDASAAATGDTSARLTLPIPTNETWTLYQGPHNANGGTQNESPPLSSLDLGGGSGHVVAAREGVVEPVASGCAGKTPDQANLVVLDHGDGWHTSYYHLVNIQVSVGQHVNRGGYLGDISTAIGCQGFANANHTHFSLWQYTSGSFSWQGQAVDLRGVDIGGWTMTESGSMTRDRDGTACAGQTGLVNEGNITSGGAQLLGGVDNTEFRQYCRSIGYSDVSQDAKDAYGWYCVDSRGRHDGFEVRPHSNADPATAGIRAEGARPSTAPGWDSQKWD